MIKAKREVPWSNIALTRLIEIRDGLMRRPHRRQESPTGTAWPLRQLADFPNLGRVVRSSLGVSSENSLRSSTESCTGCGRRPSRSRPRAKGTTSSQRGLWAASGTS